MDENDITTREAAKMLGVSTSHVCWYFNKGHLAGRRIGERVLVFNRADVERFVKPKKSGRPRKAPVESKNGTPKKRKRK